MTLMTMMIELTYISVLPFPVYVAILGSIVLSIGVFLKGVFNMAPPEAPVFYFRESSLNTYVMDKCKLKDRYFSPNYWLSSKHVQTILPIILPRPDVTYEREYLQMRDKGVVALDWAVNPQVKLKRKATILLVIPAITEGASHVSQICQTALSRGMRAVVFNRRGHGGSYLTTPKLQSFGDPTDLRQVVKYLRQRLPRSSLTAVAYGTGCGLLMSYLGEYGSSALLTVAACISPCYDVPERFASRADSLYDLVLLLRLKYQLCHHALALASVLDIDKVMASWTFSEFNRNVDCPLYGYSDLEQFWEMNNPIRDVDDIEVPVLCLNSLDDPVCSRADIPYDLFKCYPNFLLAVTKNGGHCGFLEGLPPKPWADVFCLDYLEAVVEFTTKTSQLQQHRPRAVSTSHGRTTSSPGLRPRSSHTYLQYVSNTSLSSTSSNCSGRTRTGSFYKKRGSERFTI